MRGPRIFFSSTWQIRHVKKKKEKKKLILKLIKNQNYHKKKILLWKWIKTIQKSKLGQMNKTDKPCPGPKKFATPC